MTLRVVQLVQTPQRRGAEVFAFQQSAWMRAAGHEVSTAYLYPYNGPRALPLVDGDTVLMGDARSPLERLPGVSPYLLEGVRRFVSHAAPDIVQVNGARTIKYGAALRALSRPKWKLIYRNIDSPVFWVKGPLRKAYYQRLVMPQVDGVIGVSQKTLDEVMSFYRLATPAEFIPNGVDLTSLRPGSRREAVREELGVPAGAVVMLFMGNLSAQKRPDRFLRVLAQAARAAPVVGWLLGDGPDRAQLEREAEEQGLRDVVRFLGYQSDVAPYVAAADVYVSTSDTEGIPAVVIETSYLGKPTVGMRVGGMHECVRHEETGILVDAGDENALMNACVHLASDPELRRRLGENAHAFARNTFSMETVGARYLAFYERLLGG